jgi:hypothetical protein
MKVAMLHILHKHRVTSRWRSLTTSGFSHILVPLIIIVGIGLFGTYYLVLTHAATGAYIKNANGMCVDNQSSRKVNDNPVQLWSCDSASSQGWTANGTATTAGSVVNNNGYCLNVQGAGTAPGTGADIYQCNGSVGQKWLVKPVAGSSSLATLVNPHSNLCLDNYHQGTMNGNRIWLYNCNSTTAQEWSVATANSGGSGGGGTQTGGGKSPNHWLMTSNLVQSLQSQDAASAKWYFNTSNGFIMNNAGSGISGLSATPIRNYKSYAAFSQDIANGAIPSSVHWVMYDNENWSYTPKSEAQDPAKYMKLFADLAHQHSLKVYEVPARDVVTTAGAACRPQSGENVDQAYIRCQIPADARYADIYEIQAQADQSSVTAYTNLVAEAKNQVRAQAPNIVVMSGLTTDRGDTIAQIVNCWKATHTGVQGYWMNSTSATFNVAESAMSQIRGYGG